jgi:hypothetical protein
MAAFFTRRNFPQLKRRSRVFERRQKNHGKMPQLAAVFRLPGTTFHH